MPFLVRSIVLASLVLSLAPCKAEGFADETWNSLFLTTLLAEQVRDACSEVDPALGAAVDTSLARLRAAHHDGLLTGRAIAQRRAAPDGLASTGKALADRFRQLMQQEDAQARHVRCTRLAAQLDATASRPRRELVEHGFRKWFAQQQRERQIECARLDGTARELAARLLSGGSAREQPDQLRADAKVTARAAGWCLQAQAAAAREGIHVPGNFGLIGETAAAISDAAVPMLSGRDPAAAQAHGRDRARRYLTEPDWL